MENMLKMHIKLTDQNSAVLLDEVNRSWTISDLKRHIAEQHGNIDSTNLKLIFAGRELNNDLCIKDCNIEQNTTLYGICRPSAGEDSGCHGDDSIEAGFSSLHAQIEGLSNNNQAASNSETPSLKPQLYVYCQNPCKSVQPGKLRVCCSQCKEGSFTVQQDPTCWQDVLVHGAIRGTCQTDGCHGNTSEFYFKCGKHPTTDDERSVALQHIKTNTRQVMCLTCADIRNPVLVFPCRDKHTICLECFHEYCLTQLNDRQFVQDDDIGYTLPCPNGCEHSFINEVHHFKVLGEVQYARYKHFAAEECLLQNGGVMCPTPGCGAGIFTETTDRCVVCVKQGDHGCGAVFCRQCHQPYHQGNCNQVTSQHHQSESSYRVNSSRVDRARWERLQSEETIQATTKPCPKCSTPTERNGGCMHMTCSRSQCKFDWCWVCCVEWSPRCMADHWFDVY